MAEASEDLSIGRLQSQFATIAPVLVACGAVEAESVTVRLVALNGDEQASDTLENGGRLRIVLEDGTRVALFVTGIYESDHEEVSYATFHLRTS